MVSRPAARWNNGWRGSVPLSPERQPPPNRTSRGGSYSRLYARRVAQRPSPESGSPGAPLPDPPRPLDSLRTVRYRWIVFAPSQVPGSRLLQGDRRLTRCQPVPQLARTDGDSKAGHQLSDGCGVGRPRDRWRHYHPDELPVPGEVVVVAAGSGPQLLDAVRPLIYRYI